MRSRLPTIITLVCLAAVGGILRWFDLFHLAIGIPSLILLFLFLRWWRKRTKLESEEVEEEQESMGRIIFIGLTKTIGILAFLFLIFWSASKTPIYGLFYDANWNKLSSKITILRDAQAWPKIVEVAEQHLSKPLSADKRVALAQQKYQALIEWGRYIADMKQRLTKFEEALSLAKTYRLDPQLAEAEIRAVKAEILSDELLQSPEEIPSSAKGMITQIDTSIFPPSVVVYVSIEDGAGKAIDWLERKDFRVSEDGRLVSSFTVANFSQKDTINVVMAIDISGSTKGTPLDNGKEGAKQFVNLLSNQDLLELIAFNERPYRIVGWTQDKAAIHSAIDRLKACGDTAIYDAIWLAIEDIEKKEGCKVIVLCTDGKDNSSVHRFDETRNFAKQAGIPVYVIGLQSKDLDGATLAKIASGTGGVYLEAEISAQLTELYNQIGSKIKNQYRFVLNLDRDKDGKEHILAITAGGRGKVRMERSYRL